MSGKQKPRKNQPMAERFLLDATAAENPPHISMNKKISTVLPPQLCRLVCKLEARLGTYKREMKLARWIDVHGERISGGIQTSHAEGDT